MILAVYRWRLKPGRREDFVAVWAEATLSLRQRGSGGSALFDGPDGLVWGVARWPDAETRDSAFADPLPGAFRARMDACIADRFDAFDLDAIADLWTAFSGSEPSQ